VLIFLMRKRLNGLEGGYVWQGVAIAGLGTGLMSAVVWGWGWLFADGSPMLILFGALTVGVVVYGGLMWLLKMPELLGMIRTLLRRLNRS
jgi:hypothetical protein